MRNLPCTITIRLTQRRTMLPEDQRFMLDLRRTASTLLRCPDFSVNWHWLADLMIQDCAVYVYHGRCHLQYEVTLLRHLSG
jgi:hypothetical protein